MKEPEGSLMTTIYGGEKERERKNLKSRHKMGINEKKNHIRRIISKNHILKQMSKKHFYVI